MRQRCTIGPFVVIAALLMAGAPEGPAPRVLVLGADGAPVRAAFVEALRIQLAHRVAVEAGPTLAPPSLGDRLDQAAAFVEARGALVGVWLERAASSERGGVDVVVYAVGRQRERALIEVARLRAADGPDVDRALALKVGAFLDTLLATAGARADVVESFGSTLRPAPADTPSLPPRLAFMGEVGGVATLGTGSSGAQGGLAVAAGARWRGVAWLGEVYGLLHLVSDITADGAAGRVEIEERDAGGGARVLAAGDRWAAGGFLALAARLLEAQGTSPGGSRGSVHRALPALRAGGEARLALGSQLALRAALGLEVGLRRQTFSIDDNPVSDLARVRPTGELSLVFSTP